MGAYLSSLFTQLLVCLAGLVICVMTQLPARAAGGDVIITREVQPRAATRQELVPDPNPQKVNPDHSAQIRRSLGVSGEVSDGEFAGVTTGTTLRGGVQIFAPGADPVGGALMPGRDGTGVSGGAKSGGGLGGVGRIGGDVNRSVQQGLRPLQNLGK